MTSASQPISDELIAAYLATQYAASSDQGQVVLAIDSSNPYLAALMRRHSFATGCFITACNPFGQSCPEAENDAANASLREALVARHWLVFEEWGQSAFFPSITAASGISLGAFNFGAGRLKLSREFGTYLFERVMEIERIRAAANTKML